MGESWGQVKLYRDYDENYGDSIITSGEDTLAGIKISKKEYVIRCKAKVYMHKKGNERFCQIYFIFKNIRAFSLAKENKATITFTDNSTLELPYNGKYQIFGEQEQASFPVDANNYLTEFSTKEIKNVLFETSNVDYIVPVPEQFKSKIKEIFKALLQ